MDFLLQIARCSRKDCNRFLRALLPEEHKVVGMKNTRGPRKMVEALVCALATVNIGRVEQRDHPLGLSRVQPHGGRNPSCIVKEDCTKAAPLMGHPGMSPCPPSWTRILHDVSPSPGRRAVPSMWHRFQTPPPWP